eukprot:50963-Amorphochlora_amoeboformis.AAC.1
MSNNNTLVAASAAGLYALYTLAKRCKAIDSFFGNQALKSDEKGVASGDPKELANGFWESGDGPGSLQHHDGNRRDLDMRIFPVLTRRSSDMLLEGDV